MSRNSTGVYSLPSGINPVVSDTNITANWGNTTLEDVAAALTESLSRNGQGSMLAPLKLTNGSAGSPALSFSASASTGMFRNTAGQLNFAVNGAEVFRFTAGQQLGVDGTAALPAWSFLSDPDTGIYASAANVLGFSAGGTLRALLSATAFTLQSGVVFTGSGAGLTAIPAASLTGTIPSGVLTSLNASNLDSGTIPNGRFPGALPVIDGGNVTGLNASNLAIGTLPDARFPTTLPSGVTVPAAQLSGNVAQARLASALNASGSAPLYSIRAWVAFNGTGTPAFIAGGNVSATITDNGVGDFTISFTTALPTADYAVSICCNANSVGAPARVVGNVHSTTTSGAPTLKTTTQLRISIGDEDSREDPALVCIFIVC